MSTAAIRGPGATPASRIAPSAISPANLRLRGPLAARWIGTATGSRSRDRTPPKSNSLPASRSRTTANRARSSAPVDCRSLTGPRALSPTPTPRMNRPGASSPTVRAAEAMTDGCRVATLVTAVPRVIRLVAAAAVAAVVNTSPHNSWESGNHTPSKPSRSASPARAAISPTGAHGGMRSPTFMSRTSRAGRPCGRGPASGAAAVRAPPEASWRVNVGRRRCPGRRLRSAHRTGRRGTSAGRVRSQPGSVGEPVCLSRVRAGWPNGHRARASSDRPAATTASAGIAGADPPAGGVLCPHLRFHLGHRRADRGDHGPGELHQPAVHPRRLRSAQRRSERHEGRPTSTMPTVWGPTARRGCARRRPVARGCADVTGAVRTACCRAPGWGGCGPPRCCVPSCASSAARSRPGADECRGVAGRSARRVR